MFRQIPAVQATEKLIGYDIADYQSASVWGARTREMREHTVAASIGKDPPGYDFERTEKALDDLPLSNPEEAKRKLAELKG